MSKKTIYFHIGTHKTGTTALQNFFVNNKKILSEKGFEYDFYNDIEMNQGYLAFNPGKWNDISFNIEKNYIISGEDFYSHILDSSEIIKQKLSDFNIEFIIYFKRQDLMIESVYNQLVKMHGYTKNIEELDSYNLNYYDFLTNLQQAFTDSHINVRVYEKFQFYAGTIFGDFLNIIGINNLDDFLIEEKKIVNPSLSRDKLEFVKLLNMLELPIDFRTKINRTVIESALNSGEVSLFRKQNILSPKKAQEILRKYNNQNILIAKHYLKRDDGKLFYDEIIDDKNWKRYHGLNNIVIEEIFRTIQTIDKEILFSLYDFIIDQKKIDSEFAKSANLLTPILVNLIGKDVAFQDFIPNDYFYKIEEEICKKDFDLADILREVAIAFESINDISTAHKIMYQAYLLRPNGPFIKKKLKEYKKGLGI